MKTIIRELKYMSKRAEQVEGADKDEVTIAQEHIIIACDRLRKAVGK